MKCVYQALKEVKLENENVFGILRDFFLILYMCSMKSSGRTRPKKIIDENRRKKTNRGEANAAACLLIGSHFPQWNSRIPSISHSGGKCRQEWMPVFRENFGRPNIHFHLIHKILKVSLYPKFGWKTPERLLAFFSHTNWNGNTALLTAPRCCSSFLP